MSDRYASYIAIIKDVIAVLFFLVPVVGNLVSRILRASGAPDAARKLDARIPYALAAMTEADKLAKGALVLVKAQDATETPKGPPTPPTSTGPIVVSAVAKSEPPAPKASARFTQGLDIRLFAVLAMAIPLMGCAGLLDAGVVVVNTEEVALSDLEPRLYGLEEEEFKTAIDASPDVATAQAAKANIAAKYHPYWDAYTKVRAQWVITQVAVSAYQVSIAAGGHPDPTQALAAVADLVKAIPVFEASIKTLGK